MPDIPEAAISAGAEALNEIHAKRGWNKPAPWWVKEVSSAILEAATPVLAEAWGVVDRTALRSVPCPYCGAGAGEMCRTRMVHRGGIAGYPISGIHAARKKVACDIPEVPR